MRVLFCSSPLLGYFLPLVPWAWALRAAGHSVRVATSGEGLDACGRAGLHAFDAAPGVDVDQVFRSTIATKKAAAPANRGGRFPPASGMPSPFAKVADLMTDETIRIALDFRPTLVIYPRLHVLGRLVADLLGVPVVAHSPGLPLDPEARLGSLEWLLLPSTCERHGRTLELTRPAALIHPTPPSMLSGAFPPGWSTRYVPFNGSGSALPSWLLQPPTRPRVCVTLGSVVPGMGGVGFLKHVVEALAERDVEAVLALGGADLQALGPRIRPVNAVLAGVEDERELCSAAIASRESVRQGSREPTAQEESSERGGFQWWGSNSSMRDCGWV